MTTPQCPTADLTCPTDDNMAAVAKQMHATALEIENRLFCLEQALRAGSNPPAEAAVMTVAAPAVAANVRQGINVSTSGTWVPEFRNSEFDFFGGSSAVLAVPLGAWHFGMSILVAATGAVTANTFRLARIEHTDAFGTVIEGAQKNTFDVNAGIGTVEISCSMTAQATTGNTFINFYWSHGNTGSTMQLQPGTRLWAYRIGDLSAVRTN